MLIYTVTVNDKPSSIGYASYEGAARFVASRILRKPEHLLDDSEWQMGNYGYATAEHEGNTYKIHDIRINGSTDELHQLKDKLTGELRARNLRQRRKAGVA